MTGDPAFAERVVQDYRRAGLDPKTKAMCDYVVKITRTPVETSEADIHHLMDLGFSQDDVYDIIQTAAIYNYNNRVASAAGHIPDRRYHAVFRDESPRS